MGTKTPGNDPDDVRQRRSRTKRIGKHLREMYDEVAKEDVPDDFMRLLEEADSKSSSGGDR
ncbi:NepR family anti-sigma factor [Parvularcula sp. LCG005]|uniref:NepR family anti-sigma factor n=1 Tax=Parvularcula sp. LCG005 TaxID=3078805 RepID=UPI002943EA9E|nr:NepR family anti-sigma factor [Parvularcula sp. LCG005]WOI52905.1 NepR family anti-sigma factor [Parvularcula sp. LCG005]